MSLSLGILKIQFIAVVIVRMTPDFLVATPHCSLSAEAPFSVGCLSSFFGVGVTGILYLEVHCFYT